MSDLRAEHSRLRAQVQHHKSEIYRHRRELKAAAAALTRVTEECRRRGIRVVVVPAAVEETHGRSASAKH
jgi:hypothetical protein